MPLVLIALLAWIERGAPRPARATAAAAIVAAALPGALPFPRLLDFPAISETLMLLPLWRLLDYGIKEADVATIVVPASIAVATLVLFVPRRYVLALPLLVLVYFLVSLPSIERRMAGASVGSRFSGISNPHRDWIDRAVPAGAEVAVLWTGEGNIYPVWQNEFFSRSVGTIYSIAGTLLGGLPQTTLSVDELAGLLRGPDGRPVQPRYLLVDDTFTPAGRVLARDKVHQMTLYELDGPLRSEAKVTGLYDDTWSGEHVTYTRHDCEDGTVVRVQLRSDPSLFTEPQTVVARIRRRGRRPPDVQAERGEGSRRAAPAAGGELRRRVLRLPDRRAGRADARPEPRHACPGRAFRPVRVLQALTRSQCVP